MSLQPVPLDKAYRLLNHGPTVIVSAQHDGVENAMPASWACLLDLLPPKVTVVLDKIAFTRSLVEQEEWFALQVPFAAQGQNVIDLGQSYRDNPNKLADSKMSIFHLEGVNVPLLEGCAAYLICKLIPEKYNQQEYDLFIGEVVEAWADDRVFSGGHWHFDDVDDDLKTLHYIAGGQFYRTGSGLKVDGGP